MTTPLGGSNPKVYGGFFIGETVRTLKGELGIIEEIDRTMSPAMLKVRLEQGLRLGQGLGDLIAFDPFDLDHLPAE